MEILYPYSWWKKINLAASSLRDEQQSVKWQTLDIMIADKQPQRLEITT